MASEKSHLFCVSIKARLLNEGLHECFLEQEIFSDTLCVRWPDMKDFLFLSINWHLGCFSSSNRT